MDELLLIQPTTQWGKALLDYRHEFYVSGDSMDGSAGLRSAPSLEDWLRALEDNSREETVRPGLVPSTTFLGVRARDRRLVGMIDLRHRLSSGLLLTGGHIGYSVRPSERRKGYATQMLRLVLEECRRRGLDRVLLTCYADNTASARAIRRCGGVLEDEISANGRPVQRYWISLDTHE